MVILCVILQSETDVKNIKRPENKFYNFLFPNYVSEDKFPKLKLLTVHLY